VAFDSDELVMRALVTGGGGFLGQAIVRRLRAEGTAVHSLARGDYPVLRELGVEVFRGDVADGAAVRRAAERCDVVFHVAARAGVWGRFDDYYRTNVAGTDNVIRACIEMSVPRLVYTSSPSVVFNGQDEVGINESAPYPTSYLAAYPETKALAERAVLAANGQACASGAILATVALRPHLIWGPGDNHLIPRLFDRARRGKLRRVGTGTNLVDTTYIENAVDAHLLAAQTLAPGSAQAGRAYFITNGEPIPLWTLIDRMLACGRIPAVKRQISSAAAYAAGAVLELAYRLLGRQDEPPMTRFVARQLSTAHWFDISAARRDFGYVPKVSIDEGLNRLEASLKPPAPPGPPAAANASSPPDSAPPPSPPVQEAASSPSEPTSSPEGASSPK